MPDHRHLNDNRPMGIEIERKFLVRDRSILDGLTGTAFVQGYLSTDPDRTVRVRRAGDRAFLTIKGRSVGAARPEFEYEIPLDDVDALVALCVGSPIVKTRYRIPHGPLAWEIDVFEGENAGLIVAEIELPSETTAVDPPAWVGLEVTDDPRYFNANLVAHPFRTWS